MAVLTRVATPQDLKHLSLEDLEELCAELREFIIHHVSQTGGHLASSLGAVELTVALHYVFGTPEDKILWDVGHQAYAHKIITGRKDLFPRLRQMGGLSPFINPAESVYDPFVSGHAGNAISAATVGAMARGRKHDRRRRKCMGWGKNRRPAPGGRALRVGLY